MSDAITAEKADETVGAILAFGLEPMGVGKVLPSHISLLRQVGLREMLDAVGAINALNDKPADPNGSKTFRVVPDDRLVAAVYALVHYQLRPIDDNDDLIVKFTAADLVHALVVVKRRTDGSHDA